MFYLHTEFEQNLLPKQFSLGNSSLDLFNKLRGKKLTHVENEMGFSFFHLGRIQNERKNSFSQGKELGTQPCQTFCQLSLNFRCIAHSE